MKIEFAKCEKRVCSILSSSAMINLSISADGEEGQREREGERDSGIAVVAAALLAPPPTRLGSRRF